MVAVYSYKMRYKHYKPLNDEFVRLAKLSVQSVKKYYKTKFYCDKESLTFFTDNGIFFDEVIILENDLHDHPTIFSISKIYAMMYETEPYLLLDFDVVLLEELHPSHTITYGHPEVQINQKYVGLDSLLFTYDHYIKPFNEHIRKYFNNEDLSKIDWLTYPSFCVVMVQNPHLISEIYKNIFDKLSNEDISKIPSELLEQFLCHQNIVKHKVDFGYLSYDHYENGDHVKFNMMNMLSKKYVHLNINNQKIKDELIYLEKII
jgi:hypothetical protein